LIEAYHDPVGLPTQGYGRLLSRVAWEDLSKYPAITPEQAKANLLVDLNRAARSTQGLIKVPLSPPEWAALYDFTFNVGAGNLEISTLRRKINRGDTQDVPDELAKWVYAGPVKLAGLVKRRAAEARMWTHGL
jgi:lysozyme